MRRRPTRSGFTLVDTSAIVLLGGVLLACTVPASQDARERAMITLSTGNLRQHGQAMATYAAEWNDRQFTLVADDLAAHGGNLAEALANFERARGRPHGPIVLGQRTNAAGDRVSSMLDMSVADNQRWLLPISFDDAPDGSFRALNVRVHNQYLDGRFYSPVMYAPKDAAVLKAIRRGFESDVDEAPSGNGDLHWSSYSRSAAAMFTPDVLAQTGFQDPFSLAGGLRSPSHSQTRYPDLKTSLLEHHWLQNRPVWAPDCNEAIERGRYDGCEPHYFNHYAYSAPLCGFMDGHVEPIEVAGVLEADRRVRTLSDSGLWHRRPGGATDRYFESMALDPTRASFHVFTVDGILGRDKLR